MARLKYIAHNDTTANGEDRIVELEGDKATKAIKNVNKTVLFDLPEDFHGFMVETNTTILELNY